MKDIYKNINVLHDTDLPNIVKAIDIVQNLIKKNGYIIYGGMAIDLALRKFGSRIYEDNEIPDLDFYAPNYLEVCRNIIKELKKITEANVYCIRAKFIRTMRISVGDNNFIADVSYMPDIIFQKIPTETFDGMRFIHPHVQMVDLHSSLLFPYDNSPQEVVLARWEKDITRFNLLYEYYGPKEDPKIVLPPLETVTISKDVLAYSVLGSFAAYAFLYYSVDVIPDKEIPRLPRPIIKDSEIIVSIPFGTIECYTHNTEKENLVPAFMDLMEPYKQEPKLIKYVIFNRLIGYWSKDNVRIVSVQGLLKLFLAHYIIETYFGNPNKGQVYLKFYLATMTLVRIGPADIVNPATKPFGGTNVSLGDYVRLYSDLINSARKKNIMTGPEIILPPAFVDEGPGQFPNEYYYKNSPFLQVSGPY